MKDLFGVSGYRLVLSTLRAASALSLATLGLVVWALLGGQSATAVALAIILLLGTVFLSRGLEAVSSEFLCLDFQLFHGVARYFPRGRAAQAVLIVAAVSLTLGTLDLVFDGVWYHRVALILLASVLAKVCFDVARLRRNVGRALAARQELIGRVRDAYSQFDVPRLVSSLDCYLSEDHRNPNPKVRGVGIVGLPQRPWYRADEFPFVVELEEHGDALVKEFLRVMESDAKFVDYRYGSVGRGWDFLELFEKDCRAPKPWAEELCPRTVELLKKFPGYFIRHRAYSRMRPRGSIGAHRDEANVVLNCHLGVEIPDGDCAIRVGPDVRRWKVGKCLVFDPSFEHEVWNRTDRNRTVLQVSFLRPELSAVEQQAITAAAGRSVGQRSSRGHAVVTSESS